MVEHQPKREVLEKQEQAISSLKDDIKVSQEQITQLERAGPQGGRSQALVPQGKTSNMQKKKKYLHLKYEEVYLHLKYVGT